MSEIKGNGTVAIFTDPKGIFLVCVKDDAFVRSPASVFHGVSPFDYVLPATLCQLLLHIIISQVLYIVLRPIKTPKFVCNVVGGILMGPSCLGRNEEYWKALFPIRQAVVLKLLSTVGCAYYIFIIVLKMDVRMTITAAKRTWLFGIIPVFASSGFLTLLLNLFYRPKLTPHLAQGVIGFTSSTMSLSFFPVIADALGELNLIATELGQIALSSAMCNDVMEWVHIAMIRIGLEKDLKYSIFVVISTLLFILFCIFVIRPIMKLIIRRTPMGKPVNEIYVVLILLGVLVMAGISDALGLSFVYGPLLFGLVTPSGPPLGTTLVDRCEIIIKELLLPFFFMYIGLNTDLSLINSWEEVILFQSILFAGYLGKVLACVLVGLKYDMSPKQGIVLGLMLNIKGVIELIASSSMKRKIIDNKMFSHIVLFIVEITAIVSPLIRLLYKNRPRVLHASSILEGRTRNIQSTTRIAEFRVITCIHNEGNVRGMIALLEAFNPILESPICAIVIHLIELLGKSSPMLLPIDYKNNKKFLSVNYPNTNPIMHAFKNYSNNSGGPVIVLPYINVAPYKNMHESVCNFVRDKLVPLIILPFHEHDSNDQDGHMANSIRKMNANFQKHSHCTVGLLVDRHSCLGASDSRYSFHIGIFFLGGPDDREALAMGIRMSDKPNAIVSLFRFVLRDKNKLGRQTKEEDDDDDDDDDYVLEENEEEEVVVEEKNEDEILDENLIEEFKSMKYENENVSWIEIFVDDQADLLEAIRGLEANYDLVMVGRRHHIGTFDDEEMGNFIENAKILGIIGDMLSSTEFCIGVVPVLVMQCGGENNNNYNNNSNISNNNYNNNNNNNYYNYNNLQLDRSSSQQCSVVGTR